MVDNEIPKGSLNIERIVEKSLTLNKEANAKKPPAEERPHLPGAMLNVDSVLKEVEQRRTAAKERQEQEVTERAEKSALTQQGKAELGLATAALVEDPYRKLKQRADAAAAGSPAQTTAVERLIDAVKKIPTGSK